MVRVGITGGMGMGKSTCAAAFRDLGARVVDTDDLAREVVRPGSDGYREVVDAFGEVVVRRDGTLDRGKLAAIVFADREQLAKLEAITHPRIRELWERQLDHWESERAHVGAVVIPLLYETRAEERFDAVVCVACSALTQQERLRERGWSADEITRRASAQLTAEEKMAAADFLIWTEGPLGLLPRQAALVLDRLKRNGRPG